MVKLVKEEFQQVVREKDQEIEQLEHENQQLRKLVQLHKELGTPTEKEVYDEICRYEVSLQMRDEVDTQTDPVIQESKEVNTDQENRFINKLKIDNLEDSDDKMDPQKSTSNLLMSRHSKSIEELKRHDKSHKILPSPQANSGLTTIKSENRIFSTLVHGGNKKNTVFSLKKILEDDDPYKIKNVNQKVNEPDVKNEEEEKEDQFNPINMNAIESDGEGEYDFFEEDNIPMRPFGKVFIL